MEEPNVGIYLDFENLAISAETVYPGMEKPLSVGPIIEYATQRGALCVKKAYADWNKEICSQYQQILLEAGFELVHMPETNLQGKNGVDVKLTVDVMDHLERLPHVKVMVIGSGDADFIPLLQYVKSKGVNVSVIGFEHSVARLIKKNSIEFTALESIFGTFDVYPNHINYSPPEQISYGRSLINKYIETNGTDEPVFLSTFKQALLKIDPNFNEKLLGFTSFTKFLQAYEGDVVRKLDMRNNGSPTVYLHSSEYSHSDNTLESASNFLAKKMRYIKNTNIRIYLSSVLFDELEGKREMSMNEMIESVVEKALSSHPLAKTDVKKYVNTLFTGKAFSNTVEEKQGSLLSQPFQLSPHIKSPEELDHAYLKRLIEILKNRFSDLTNDDLLSLLV